MKTGMNNKENRMIKTRRLIWIIITAAVMIFIFIQSAFPAELSDKQSDTFVFLLQNFSDADIHLLIVIVRKAAHLFEYMLLGVSLSGFFSTFGLSRKKTVLFSWITGTVYAASDELHQLFVPGRSSSFTDVMLDSLGVILGIAVFYIIITIIHGRMSKNRQ